MTCAGEGDEHTSEVAAPVGSVRAAPSASNAFSSLAAAAARLSSSSSINTSAAVSDTEKLSQPRTTSAVGDTEKLSQPKTTSATVSNKEQAAVTSYTTDISVLNCASTQVHQLLVVSTFLFVFRFLA